MSSNVNSRHARRLGFTLVELLVVIGIIALLISILLPTLSRAREAGNRTMCLSNMRTIFTLMKMYENNYKGAAPLGYASLELQANYFLSFGVAANIASPGTTIRYVGLGLLFPANLIKSGSGKIFYCPSFQGDVNHDYDAPSNPWPPSNAFYQTGGTVAQHGCRMSFSQRPIGAGTGAAFGAINYSRIGYKMTAADPFAPEMKAVVFPTGTAQAGVPTVNQFPKLAKYKNAAIVSDINSGEGRLVVGHKKGINVLYASGGAKWLDLSAGKDLGNGFNQSIKTLIASESGFGSGFDKAQAQIWFVLDAQ